MKTIKQVFELAQKVGKAVSPTISVKLIDDYITFDGWVTLCLHKGGFLVEKVIHCPATREEPEDVDVCEVLLTDSPDNAIKRCIRLTVMNRCDIVLQNEAITEAAVLWEGYCNED